MVKHNSKTQQRQQKENGWSTYLCDILRLQRIELVSSGAVNVYCKADKLSNNHWYKLSISPINISATGLKITPY
jgi:hypothetical protein